MKTIFRYRKLPKPDLSVCPAQSAVQAEHGRSRSSLIVLWMAIALLGLNSRAKAGQVQLKILTLQESFLIGEPVVIVATLTNTGTNPLEFRVPDLEARTLRIFIQRAQLPLEEYRRPVVKDPKPPHVLEAGAERQEEQVIHYNYSTKKLAFPEAGRYLLRAEYSGLIGVASQPPAAQISIDVLAPPPEDQEGSQLFAQPATADIVVNNARDPKVIEKLEDFAARHSNSRFNLYASYHAGLYHLRAYQDKPPDFEKAERLLKSVDQEKFPLRPNVWLALSALRWEQGDVSEAMAWLDKITNRYSRSGVAESALRARAAYRSGPPRPKKIPSPVRTAMPTESKVAIEALLTRYFGEYQRENLEGVLGLQDESFRYNDSLDKQRMRRELAEEFARIKSLNGKFEVRFELQKTELVDGAPKADVLLTFLLDGREISPSKRVRIGFVQRGNDWLIRSWNTVKK